MKLLSMATLIMLFSSISIASGKMEKKMNRNNLPLSEDFCRICCTISTADSNGGLVGFTACAGGIFTSCETATEKACMKAASNALEAAKDAL